MHVLAGVVCGLIGLVVGARLQLIITRTPMRERVLGIHQHCTRCGTALATLQRYPWSTYLSRSNACITCNKPVWTRWPWVELVTAATLAAVGLRFGFAWALPAYLVGFAAMVAIFIIDLRHQIIPNRIIYPALASASAWLGIVGLVQGRPGDVRDALLGVAIGWVFFFVVFIVYPAGMGFGDIRLAGLMGLFTGWLGIENVIVGLVLGIALGGLFSMGLLLLRFVGLRTHISYGPFLITGGVLSIVWGENIANWWLGS